MTIPQVVDGVTDADAAFMNQLVDAANQANAAFNGAGQITTAAITPALGEYEPLQNMRAGVVNMLDYTNESDPLNTAIQVAADAGGGDVVVHPHTRSVPISIPTGGIRLVAAGAPDRWRSAKQPVMVSYTGDGAALWLAPAASSGIDSFECDGIQFDGRASDSGTVGIHFDASASNSYIEAVRIARSSFTNFGLHQAHVEGIVFDISFDRVTMHDKNRASGDLFRSVDLVSQITFNDCWLMNYAEDTWCVVTESASSLRFVGGTVAPYGENHGINALGALGIFGTHIEGKSSSYETTIGVRYVGSSGAFISPTTCSHHGIGIQIGDGTSAAARGWVIGGQIGFNNVAAGGCDIEITGGGHRYGTILDLGYAGGDPTIRDLRLSNDSVRSVLNLGKIKDIRANAYTATNVTTDRAFDADSTSTAELADVLGTLIADLRTIGIVG